LNIFHKGRRKKEEGRRKKEEGRSLKLRISVIKNVLTSASTPIAILNRL